MLQRGFEVVEEGHGGGTLGLLIPKMPESGRAEVEAVAAAVDEEVVAARTAVRIGPTADEAQLLE